jgi:hypothetical protein
LLLRIRTALAGPFSPLNGRSAKKPSPSQPRWADALKAAKVDRPISGKNWMEEAGNNAGKTSENHCEKSAVLVVSK